MTLLQLKMTLERAEMHQELMMKSSKGIALGITCIVPGNWTRTSHGHCNYIKDMQWYGTVKDGSTILQLRSHQELTVPFGLLLDLNWVYISPARRPLV